MVAEDTPPPKGKPKVNRVLGPTGGDIQGDIHESTSRVAHAAPVCIVASSHSRIVTRADLVVDMAPTSSVASAAAHAQSITDVSAETDR